MAGQLFLENHTVFRRSTCLKVTWPTNGQHAMRQSEHKCPRGLEEKTRPQAPKNKAFANKASGQPTASAKFGWRMLSRVPAGKNEKNRMLLTRCKKSLSHYR